MGTVRPLDCQMCSHSISNYEDKCNEDQDQDRQPQKWWYCSNARSPHGHDKNGQLLWLGKPCETNHCPECAPRNVCRYEVGFHLVNPSVFVTLNDVAPDHDLGRLRMTSFRKICNAHGYRFENAYAFERYTERGHQGLHVHLLGHGDTPSQEVMEHAAEKAGFDPCRMGTRVDAQEVTHHGNLGYLLKSAKDPSTRSAFLYDNGGRLLSTTRGFWRTPTGEVPRGGIRGFLREMR